MSRKLSLWVVLCFLITGSILCAQTEPADTEELAKQAAELDQIASKAGNEKTYQSLSSQLDIPVDTLKAQQADTQFGFGELFIANALAKASGKEFAVLSQQFKAGQGWGAIAKENGLKLGAVVSGLKKSTSAVEREQIAAPKIERSGLKDKPNRLHQSDRPQGNARGRGRK